MIYRGIFAFGLIENLYTKFKLDQSAYSILLVVFSLACIAIPYLIGSLNFAIIISKIKYGEDIRNYGSGNGGMTNMLRTYGKKLAVYTLVGDMLKSVVSVTLGCFLLGIGYGGYLAGFFCMLGHMFPIYYRFRGGKGVAVIAAMILMLNPIIFLILFVMFAAIVFGTKYVSLGSVVAVGLFPVILNRFDIILMNAGYKFVAGPDTLFAVLIAISVIFMHRQNLKRIMNGTESKISFGKGSHEKKENDPKKNDGESEK